MVWIFFSHFHWFEPSRMRNKLNKELEDTIYYISLYFYKVNSISILS